MVRYMLYLSYIGTRYRGAQKQSGCERVLDVDTIQGAIEAGFLTLMPQSIIKPSVALSSRTDAGVHALFATAQIELENKHGTIYDSASVLKWMNRYFTHCGHEIRITSFFPVLSTFHARFAAQSRTYVYRIAFPNVPDEHRLPIAEVGHTWNIISNNTVDIEKIKAATRLFMGTKNFETFTGKLRNQPTPRFVRNLNELRVEKAQPLMPMDELSNNYQYWNILCSSRSFLYNQVRRIVSSLVGVGVGILTERDVNIMLHVPSSNSWNPRIPVAPPHGLYLKEIAYDPEELARSIIRETTN